MFDKHLNNILGNLQQTMDPRDQGYMDINQYLNTGQGNANNFLNLQLSQLDPRDQEYADIQKIMNDPFRKY